MKLQLLISSEDVKLAVIAHVEEQLGVDLTEVDIPETTFSDVTIEVDSSLMSSTNTGDATDEESSKQPPKKKRNRRTKKEIEEAKRLEEAENARQEAEDAPPEEPKTSGEEPSEEKLAELSEKKTPINKLLGETPQSEIKDPDNLDDDVPFDVDTAPEAEPEVQEAPKKRSLFN